MTMVLAPGGIPVSKQDGECCHTHCQARINFAIHEKPPEGWAEITLTRYSKKGGSSTATLLACPKHTIVFSDRVPSLFSQKTRTRVVIESPFAGTSDEETERNLRYLRAAMADAFKRNEAPFASHGLYTQKGVLDDKIQEERKRGIEAGFEWGLQAQKVCVYTDLGISNGMKLGIERYKQNAMVIDYRSLPDWARPDAEIIHEDPL